ncbi:glycoside hydrolase superfamily [Blastocladiella britannica]|nr:glycoside hydrolase superfamily [Blastocladiella britannica]
MAATKLNVFHWHIVDATSFPFQFKEAPEMASKGAYSAREVYTEEMIIDFVEYCRLRGIRVMPEYDMPGHTTAWARSYPDATMCVGSRAGKSGFAVEPFSGHLNPYAPATYDVVGKILQASNRLFPDAYIHMGHDEINPKCWATLPRNGQDIKQVLKDFHAGLRPLVPKNKRVMLWQDPFLTYQMENEKQPDGGFFQAVAIWGTGTKAGDQAAIRQIRAAGKQVLLGDYTAWYLDCGMGAFVTDSPPTRNGWCTFSSWQNMYYNTVFPADSGTPESASGEQVAQLTIANDAVLGAEVSLWSELIDGANLFTTSFPRTLGFAERVWSNTNVTTGGDPGTSGDTLDEVYDRIDYARTRLLTMRGINSQALQPTWCRGRTGECRMDF